MRASYGTWRSPVGAHAVASVRYGQLAVDGDDIYWVEARPDEGGRNVLVRRSSDGRVEDVTGPGTNVRSRVHEYGGAAYVVAGGTVYYSEFADQQLYRLPAGGAPEPLTPAGAFFYADGSIDPARRRLVCVREDHTAPGREALTTLVSVPLDAQDGPGRVLVSGHDFYGSPRFSPDGSQLAWIAWSHPQMPWDGTELWLAAVSLDGSIGPSERLAGGESESVLQPAWSPDGRLYFLSDRSGWWNLYRVAPSGIEAVCPAAHEFGRPPWQLGTSTWAFADASRIVAAMAEGGRWRLVTIDVTAAGLPAAGVGWSPLDGSDIEPGESLVATDRHVVVVGGSSSRPDAVVRVDLSMGSAETLREPATAPVDVAYVSHGEEVEFPTDDGLTAHMFYYPPRNPAFVAPGEERPPLVVVAHGGPTAATHARLNLELQFWTSRGFAVADVNYGGSSGYGREYRRRLVGRWGVVDVADCVHAARHLVERGSVDPRRLIIRGRSAGGYTALAALAFHPGVFRAGASYYGVADLALLARDTHKFEAHYLDSLVGPYPGVRELYRARSPVHHVERISCPVIFFQGLEDRVVPPNQARMMADALRKRGLPVALVELEGEQHGFRKKENIVRCLEAELYFYGRVFGFTPAGPAPHLTIDNLD